MLTPARHLLLPSTAFLGSPRPIFLLGCIISGLPLAGGLKAPRVLTEEGGICFACLRAQGYREAHSPSKHPPCTPPPHATLGLGTGADQKEQGP